MNPAKAWLLLRGYKRHAGAVMALIPMILRMAGLENEQTESIYKAIEQLGVIVFGIGWVDKGAAYVAESVKKK